MHDEFILSAHLLRGPRGRTRDEIREEVAQHYRCHRHHIFHALLGYTRDPAVAEELMQEAFFRLYKHYIAGHPVDNVVTWTMTVARNLATDRVRDRKREDVASEESWLMLMETRPDPAPSSESVLIERQTKERIAALLELLPELQKKCLELYARGSNFREIAESLNIPYHHALLHISEGRKRMKRLAERNRP